MLNWPSIGRNIYPLSTLYAITRTAHTVSASQKRLGEICRGCGVTTQTSFPGVSGYVPKSVVEFFNNGWRKRLITPRGVPTDELQRNSDVGRRSDSKFRAKSSMLYCQRCFRVQNYRIDSDISYTDSSSNSSKSSRDGSSPASLMMDKIAANVPDNAVVITTVDILDFESSIVPEIFETFSRRGVPVIGVLTKLDCLPVIEAQFVEILTWAEKTSNLLRKCRGDDGRLNVVPVSSVNEKGFDKLESRLAQYISSKNPRPIYVLGRENSGKSTFLNRFLRYIGYKHLGCVHYKRGVGGITRSPFPGTTAEFIRIPVGPELDIFDSPGIPLTGTIHRYLTLSEDFRDISWGHSLQPKTLSIKEGKSLLIGALCRIEVTSGTSAMISSFVSPKVTIHVATKSRAEDLLKRKAGTFLYPPHVSGDSAGVHPIADVNWVKHKVETYCGPSNARDDIVVSGLGWFSICGNGKKIIHVWVPEGVNVFRRPSIIPNFVQRFGAQPFYHRMQGRGLTVNKKKKEVIKSLRQQKEKTKWRDESRQQFEDIASPPTSIAPEDGFVSHDVGGVYLIRQIS